MTNEELIKDAKREYMKQWREKNKERIKEYKREWASNNKDKVQAINKRYYRSKQGDA